MLHKHSWKIIAKTYSGTAQENGILKGDNFTERIIFGVTTILWECQICQQIRKEEMLGKEVESELVR